MFVRPLPSFKEVSLTSRSAKSSLALRAGRLGGADIRIKPKSNKESVLEKVLDLQGNKHLVFDDEDAHNPKGPYGGADVAITMSTATT
jgi:hypothetical protein